MGQDITRKNAGVGWLKRQYHRLYEPRYISAIYGLVYFIAAVVSTYNFFDPPRTVVAAVDNPILLWIALSAMTAGGALGLITVANGRYWLERYAATMLGVGLTVYWGIGVWLVWAAGGSRWLSLMTTTFAILLVALRFYWVMNRPYNPRNSPIRE